MKRNWRSRMLFLLTFIIGFSLTACGTQKETIKDEDGKIKIRAFLGGGDISDKIEAMVNDFNSQSSYTKTEIVPMPADTSSMVTVMFNSGNTPTVMSLETGDLLRAKDKLEDLSDLACVKEASDGTLDAVEEDGAIYGVPYRIEGMGLIYNRKVLDRILGEDFDPNTIHTLEELTSIFQKIQDSGVAPIVLGAQDWSLSTHLTTDIYTGQSDDPKEQRAFIERLKSGKED